jgi:hypothetical protein
VSAQRLRLISGWVIAVLSATLMLTGVLEVTWGAALGMVGVGLLGTSVIRRDAR